MGYYANPPGTTKEAWLADHGELMGWKNMGAYHPKYGEDLVPDYDLLMSKNLFNGEHFLIPVVLVDNRHFTAAAIAYCKDEYIRFTQDDSDKRPTLIFLVEKALLDPFLPEELRG